MGVTLQMWHIHHILANDVRHIFGVFLVWQTGVTLDMRVSDWRTSHFGMLADVRHICQNVTDVCHNFKCDICLFFSLIAQRHTYDPFNSVWHCEIIHTAIQKQMRGHWLAATVAVHSNSVNCYAKIACHCRSHCHSDSTHWQCSGHWLTVTVTVTYAASYSCASVIVCSVVPVSGSGMQCNAMPVQCGSDSGLVSYLNLSFCLLVSSNSHTTKWLSMFSVSSCGLCQTSRAIQSKTRRDFHLTSPAAERDFPHLWQFTLPHVEQQNK